MSAARTPAGGRAGTMTGTRRLLVALAEQDRASIAPWVALITVLSASSVLVYPWIFPDAASRLELAATVGANPALGLIFGPARDLSTADGFNAWRALSLGGFFAALMAIFAVVRNSRALEDSGQAELVAAGVLGRGARLGAAVGLAALASVALGVVSALVTVLLGGSLVDSLTLSATFTASGLMFAGVAAVAAQLGSDARTASTLAVVALGSAFLLRGWVDAGGGAEWMRWLSPLGWMHEVRPAAGNHWLPLLAALGLSAVLVAVAVALQSRRDFGQGVVPVAPGPARGRAAATLTGFVLLLHRGPLASWAVAFVVVGAVFGTLATSVGELIAENPTVGVLIAAGGATEKSLVLQLVLTLLSLLGTLAAVLGVQVVMRLRTEEVAHRVEPVLGTAVPRSALLLRHALVALVAPAVAMLLGGAVLAWVAASQDASVGAGEVVAQSVATVPAAWVLVALALAAVGARPRMRMVGWAGVVASFALTILGPIFRLEDWVLGISPFWHVPDVNAAEPDLTGLVWLALVTAVLLVVAFVGFRHRDVD